MLHRYGEFVVRRARLLLAVSAVLLVAAGIFGGGAFGKLKNGGFDDPAAESTRAQHLIDTRYAGQTNLVLLVTAKTGTVDDPAARPPAGSWPRTWPLSPISPVSSRTGRSRGRA